jgi:tetratricopeptide (TPR) repeat protein
MDADDISHEEKADSFARQGKMAEAIGCLDCALQKDPDNDVILNNTAIALITICRYEEALKNSRRAVSINPDAADNWVNMGVALEKLNRLSEAAEALEHAVAVNPYEAYARALLGIVYQKLNQEDRAEAQNRKLQEMMFPNEYAGFFFGTAAFLLGILMGGIHSVEGKPLEVTISSQMIIIIFFGIICFLYWKSLRQQWEISRSVVLAPHPLPISRDVNIRGRYYILTFMIIVFAVGIIAGAQVWNMMV